MTEHEKYKREMNPTAEPEPMCVRLCSTVKRLEQSRNVLLDAIWEAIHGEQPGMLGDVYAVHGIERDRAALEGRDSE